MFLRTVDAAFARFQAKGEAAALAIVFDRTAPELLRLARHLATAPSEADDLVQATFVTAIEAAATHERGRPVLPWLTGILANHARAHRRRARRDPDPSRLRADVVRDVHAEVAGRELHAGVVAAIDRLPEVYRPVLRLWLEHGLEAHEIAATLERPAGTVRAQISRGLEFVRRALPPSLVGGVAVAAMTRPALAAVRANVLARCHGTSTGLTSALCLGGLVMLHKKVAVAGVALAFGLFAWLAVPPPADAVPSAASGRDGGPVAAQSAADAPAAAGTAPVVAARTPAVAPPPEPKLPPPAALIVRVEREGSHAPCAGYGVAIVPLAEVGDLGRVSSFVATDVAGIARFDGIEPGHWMIELDRTGNVGFAMVAAGEPHEHVVALPERAVVAGTVVDPAGQPVPAAEIVVQGSRLAAPRVAVADASGRFEVRDVQGELQARHAGYAPSLAVAVRGMSGQRVEVELRLRAGGRRILGRAVDCDGRPIAGAAVAVVADADKRPSPWDQGRPQPRPLWLRTDGDGRFASDEVAAAVHVVLVRSSDAQSLVAWANADTSAGDAFVELRAAAPAVVAGTVRRDGRATGGVEVTAWPEQCDADIGFLLNLVGLRRASVGDDGAFELAGCLPGQLSLRVVRGGETLATAVRRIAPGETVRWDPELGGGRPLRIVVNSAVELPAGTTLMVWQHGEASPAPSMLPLSRSGPVECARTGGASVDVVVASLSGGRNYVQMARVRNVPAHQDELAIDVAATDVPAAAVTGRLVDRAGRPVAAATVLVRRTDAEQLIAIVAAVTGTDGRFEAGPLPFGTFTLAVGEPRAPQPVGGPVVIASPREHVGDVVLDG